ncbi:TonB-dependent receptor family protein [Rhizobacter sp. LjRoot28]|uniref:TonB-dependent receptor family protein n=1 Tax=Rhizobacter sp. LjRoot28 TaxID=3342309 RepID=UPI003ECFCC13
MSRFHGPAWVLLPLCAAAAHAQSPSPQAPRETELAPVVVTSRKNPDQSTLTQPDLPTARARIEQTPGGVGVVDAASYRSGRVATLTDALGGATGVYVQPRFGAEESRVSIRGSGLQRTFHGRGLKLMQDGVPLNLADGSFDFQAVEPLSARYVEVWRGANALQYGAANLGGAVNFVSPNGYNADDLRLRVEGGSFGYARAQLSTGGVTDRLDHYVALTGFRQDGHRDHARQETGRLSANLGFTFTPQAETRFYFGHVDSRSDLPGSITRGQLEQDPRQAQAGNVTLDQERNIRWTRLSNKTVLQDGTHRFEGFAYVSDKRLNHPIFQVIDQQSLDAGLELRYVNSAAVGGRGNRLTVGIAPSRGVTDEDRHTNVGGAAAVRTNQSRQTASNLEVYAENQHEIVPQWALVAGLQHVRASRRLEDQYVAGTTADPVDEGFSRRYEGTNPKLGLRHDLSPDAQVFANLSRSFEPPTFGELAGGVRPVANAAQRADTFEVGTRGRGRGVNWDVVFYESHVQDELLQIALNSAGASTTVNAPRTLHRGIELGLSGESPRQPTGRVEWRLNALWNHFRFRNDPTYGDNRLPGVPRYFARAQAAYRFSAGTLLAVHTEGATGYPIDFSNSFAAKRYAIWGLRASGDVRRGLSWFVDGRNLSDRRYAATTGVVRDAGGRDTAQFLPGDGRSLFVGLDWALR